MRHKMRMAALLAIKFLIILPLIVQAQDSSGLKKRTIQAGFITPLSSNGLNSWKVTNKFSLNILAGYAGGVSGAEFSGLGSLLRGDMHGAQFAGLGNIVLKETKGAQFSGLFNIGIGNVQAGQFAGLLNINIAETKGFMVAGFVNINAGTMDGTQLAGFVNFTTKLKGTQIGVFNYVDSLEHGVPIGVLSFVKNGYTTVEIGTTETLYGVASFKTGVKQFYNILSVGGGTRNGLSLFAWGYGLGAFIPVGNKAGISIDGVCYQVNEGEWFTDQLNLLNKLAVNVSLKLSNHLAIFGGISWNVAVADITDEYGDQVVSHIAPWSVFNETYNDYLNVKMYPGFSAGIRL